MSEDRVIEIIEFAKAVESSEAEDPNKYVTMFAKQFGNMATLKELWDYVEKDHPKRWLENLRQMFGPDPRKPKGIDMSKIKAPFTAKRQGHVFDKDGELVMADYDYARYAAHCMNNYPRLLEIIDELCACLSTPPSRAGSSDKISEVKKELTEKGMRLEDKKTS